MPSSRYSFKRKVRFLIAKLAYHGILLPVLEREMSILRFILNRGDFVIDVGANSGIYSFYLSYLVGSTGRVISFEPNEDNCDELVRLSKTMRISNIYLFKTALGDSEGKTIFNIPKNQKGLLDDTRAYVSSLSLKNDYLIEKEVEVSTLDSVLTKYFANDSVHIKFLKIDVEGYEYFMIKGGLNMLRKDKPIILCEIEEKWQNRYGKTSNSLISLILSIANYEMFIYDRQKLRPARAIVDGFNNYIFIDKEQVTNKNLKKLFQ